MSAAASGASRGDTPSSVVPLLILGAIASLLLFWNLGARYLWQDEAACAVLAERLVEHGRPLGYDGRNLITMDEFRPEEAAGVERRVSDADTALRFFVDKGDFKGLVRPSSDTSVFLWQRKYRRDHYELVGIVEILSDRTEAHWGDAARRYSPGGGPSLVVHRRKEALDE